MRTLFSYCSAKSFLTGIMPLASLSPAQIPADNDNDPLLPFPGVWT
jgi:hypothetical protein